MKKVLRVILLIVNVLFVVALIFSTLAGAMPPSRYPWVSMLSYTFFPLLLVNVMFILIWLCLSRWEFLLSTAAIVLRFSFVPLFFQIGGTQQAEVGEDTLKVMTFNVHGFKGMDSDTLMTADSGGMLFLSLVDEEQPDVLCMQEFFPPTKVRVVDSLLARGYKHYCSVHGDTYRSQAVIFSRCELEGHVMDNRTKFYADLSKNGQKVRLCCVHLDSYGLSDDDIKSFEKLAHAKPDSTTHNTLRKFVSTVREHETEWLTELLPLIESTETPIIVAGDFNDTPASYIYRQATERLVDAYVKQGRGFGTTYHGPYPSFRIDYILHSPTMQTLSYNRIKTPISDHYPIVATLRMASAE